MTLLVRNEEDIIEDNLWFHHAQGVDSFIITDNLSTDATADIIRAVSRELEIDYIYQPEDNYSQSKWVTEMARRASLDHAADWVINNDADEFWSAAGGDLKALLATIPADVGALNVRRHNAVLTIGQGGPLDATCHPRMNAVFESDSLTNLGTPLPGKCLHRASGAILVAQGNHAVEGVPGRVADMGEELRILHYPYRSLSNYKQKIVVGGAAYGRNTELSEKAGSTWREYYKQIDNGVVERLWNESALPREEIIIGLALGTLFRDSAVQDCLLEREQRDRQRKLQTVLTELRQKSESSFREFARNAAQPIARAEKEIRPTRPMYYNLEFCLSGPQRQLDMLSELQATGGPADLCQALPRLRDALSLFPSNTHLKDFLGQLLSLAYPEEAARLRADCSGKRVILHTSCLPRMDRAEASCTSFAGQGEGYHHIILVGKPGAGGENETPLTLRYDGRVLTVPVPDNYENLHRKLFYALTLLDLLAEPALVLKLDDNISLQDHVAFESLMDAMASQGVDYAGRAVGAAAHQGQWHGWHISKCEDPLIEARGYQYPLPRRYAAGGYGYILGRRGLAACSYMYLAMKEFFAMRAVGLEDAYVGHALYAEGIDLHDISSQTHLLTMPGLTDSVLPG